MKSENEVSIDTGTGLQVRWSTVSIALSVIAVGSLGTLVVVTSVKNIDALSTVALSLAVLSFAAQLIVSLAQGHQTARLNADTQAALAEMRATTASLLANQRDQFNKVLEAAIGQAIPAAVEDLAKSEESESDLASEEESQARVAELEERITYRLMEALAQPSEPTRVATKQLRPTRDPEFEKLLKSYPSREEGEPVLKTLEELAPRTLATLGRYTSVLLQRAPKDRSIRLKRRADTGRPRTADSLIRAGLLEEVTAPPPGVAGDVAYRLTDTGVIAVRLLSAQGDVPDWAADLTK